MTQEMVRGLALSCTLNGKIVKLVYDGLNAGKNIKYGKLFVSLVDEGSFEKASDFIRKIQEEKAAFDWQLNLPADQEILVIHFSGFIMNDEILIVGAKSRDEMAKLFEELTQINDEQVNHLGLLMKNFSTNLDQNEYKDSNLYDEIGRLNNELTTAKRELTKKNIQLSKLNQEKNQFLGMAAHDLRNPLSVIMMYSDFIIEEAADDLGEEHQEFLQVIRSSSEFMLKLIDNLLDVSKIESGKLELELESTNIIKFIEHNLELNRVLADKKHIKIDFTYDDGLTSEIEIDRSKIDQVLNNLISNAIKFSEPYKNWMTF
jgi:two-component system, OmpR family, sensor kinase